MENVINLAIPFFLLFMGLEILYSRVKHKGYYEVKDSMSNLGAGILSQLSGIIAKAFGLYVYVLIYDFLHADNSWIKDVYSMDFLSLKGFLSWSFAFVWADFCYYWFHRHSHEINLFWAFHIVHHSSEEYNLSVALRQSGLGFVISVIYRSGGAVLGIPPEMFIFCYALNLLYQFWIHTKMIDKMGPFELVFNTPSHHRVHHSRQSKYLDKNYAGVFIIWDRMFGTFIKEEDEIVYGIYPRVTSYNAIKANIDPIRELFNYFIKAKGISNKVNVLFSSPLWIYENFKINEPKGRDFLNKTQVVSTPIFIFYVVALLGSVVILFTAKKMLWYETWGLIFISLGCFYFIGNRLDKEKAQ